MKLLFICDIQRKDKQGLLFSVLRFIKSNVSGVTLVVYPYTCCSYHNLKVIIVSWCESFSYPYV